MREITFAAVANVPHAYLIDDRKMFDLLLIRETRRKCNRLLADLSHRMKARKNSLIGRYLLRLLTLLGTGLSASLCTLQQGSSKIQGVGGRDSGSDQESALDRIQSPPQVV